MLRKIIPITGCYNCVLVEDGVCKEINKNVQEIIDAHVGFHPNCTLGFQTVSPICFDDVRHRDGDADGDIKRCNNHKCNHFLQGEQGFSRKWPSRCNLYHLDENLEWAGGGKFHTLYWRWPECLAETGEE